MAQGRNFLSGVTKTCWDSPGTALNETVTTVSLSAAWLGRVQLSISAFKDKGTVDVSANAIVNSAREKSYRIETCRIQLQAYFAV